MPERPSRPVNSDYSDGPDVVVSGASPLLSRRVCLASGRCSRESLFMLGPRRSIRVLEMRMCGVERCARGRIPLVLVAGIPECSCLLDRIAANTTGHRMYCGFSGNVPVVIAERDEGRGENSPARTVLRRMLEFYPVRLGHPKRSRRRQLSEAVSVSWLSSDCSRVSTCSRSS